MLMVVKQSLYIVSFKGQTRHNNTTDCMKQINLQATGDLDDLAHF